MKILTPGMHGLVDYLIVVFLWASPTIFILPDDIARYTYLLGFIFLVFTMVTDSTSGIFRFVSMPMHGLIELVAGILLIIIAYTLLKYDKRAHDFYIGFGILLLFLFAVTDYTYKERRFTRSGRPIRHRDLETE